MDIELIQIGVINSQYSTKKDSPRQGRYSDTNKYNNSF